MAPIIILFFHERAVYDPDGGFLSFLGLACRRPET